jgi:hypothetical protein
MQILISNKQKRSIKQQIKNEKAAQLMQMHYSSLAAQLYNGQCMLANGQSLNCPIGILAACQILISIAQQKGKGQILGKANKHNKIRAKANINNNMAYIMQAWPAKAGILKQMAYIFNIINNSPCFWQIMAAAQIAAQMQAQQGGQNSQKWLSNLMAY